MSPRIAAFAVSALAFFLLGCGGEAPKSPRGADGEVMQSRSAAEQGAAGVGREAGGQPVPGVDPKVVNAPVVPAERKIIFRATLELIVSNLDEAVPQVEKLVAEQKGYVAKSEVRGDTGSRRSAVFSLRVPVDAFPAVRERLVALGTPERNAVESDDVTEEFVDVQARIRNLKEQEDKLNELLKEKRKEEKLEDIIRVSDRIAEVRRDVERTQGRLNYLANMTALATINLTLKEIKNYQPPTAPTFRGRVAAAFESSWEALVAFAEGVALVAVRLTPWLPILIPAGLALAWAVRHLRREYASTPAAPPPSAPPPEGGPPA